MRPRAGSGWLLPAITFLLCVLPATSHWSPGRALGYLWEAAWLGVGAGVGAGLALAAWQSWPAARRWALVPVALFLAVAGWGVVTTSWSSSATQTAAVVSLVLAALAALLPALALLDVDLPELALQRTAGAAVAGTAVNWLLYGLSLPHRIAAPLGPASTIHLPLILCVAILLGAVVTSRGGARVAWGALTGLGMLLTVGAQSRAGLVCLVLLAWIAVLRQAVRAARVPWVTALVATALTVGLPLLLLWLRPSATIADAPRMENTRTAARAWADGGPPAVVAGRGSGELWPWLSYEALGVGKPDTFVVASPWGSLLYHPHSTFLGVLTELGIVAAVVFVVAVGLVLAAAVVALGESSPARWLPAAALVATVPGLFTDTYLWRGFPAAVVWWAAGVAVARWAADRDGVRRWARWPLDRWLPGGRQ